LALLDAGTAVEGKLFIDATTEPRWTSNVIATTKGGDKNNIVFAGGHTDSVPQGPGINDDGSGTMSILDIALRLPLFSVKNAVRFGFWTAEEFGLVGSEHYVTHLSPEEQQKIALYLNFDMVASPNFGYFIYDGDGSAFNLTGPAGSDHIEKTFEDWFKSKRLVSAPTEFSGRSDYGPFLDVGIPSGGLFTGAEDKKTEQEAKWWGGNAGESYDKCYHLACDDLSNLNTEAWVQNTRAAAHSIATYARSLNGIPREKRTVKMQSRLAGLSYDERRHYSCGHKIESS
jgi:Zn-dependent M28 family amino/carboxypeptidase